MGRHSKNAGTMGAEALTYHEKRALGYGTVKERLGKVSVRDGEMPGARRRRSPLLPSHLPAHTNSFTGLPGQLLRLPPDPAARRGERLERESAERERD